MKSSLPSRKRIAAAFRRLARGVNGKAAYASTVRFYRSGGQPWTRQLGEAAQGNR